MRFPLCLLFLFCLIIPAPGHALEVPDEFRGGIVVVGGDNVAPMTFLGLNREPKGYLCDYWRLWSEKTGVTVEFKLVSWAESLELMKSGRPYVHAGLYKTPERQDFLDYAHEIHGVGVALYVPKSSSIESLSSIGTGLVAVLAKGASRELLENKYPGVSLELYTTYDEMIEGYTNGDVDAMVTDQDLAVYYLGQRGVLEAHDNREQISQQVLFAAVPKGQGTLLNLVDEGMSLISQAEVDQIIGRWYVGDTSISRNLKIGLAVSVFILLAGLAYVLFGGQKSTPME